MGKAHSVLLVTILFFALSMTMASVPPVHAYKSKLEVPLSNGHKITVYFDDAFPDGALSYNTAILQSDIPRIAELFYMPDHDFDVTYYALVSPGAYAGHRSVWIYVYSDDSPSEDIIVHEFTHTFQFEADSPWVQPPQFEAVANAVEEIVAGGGGWDSVMAADNGQVLYAKTKLYNTYHLGTAWVKLYAYNPSVFRSYTTSPGSFDDLDLFNALMGDMIIDSRPLARWVYEQGLGYVGPTESGFYLETQAYGVMPGVTYSQTWVQTTLVQWVDEGTVPSVVAPQSVTCKFYQLTGELLSEVPADSYGRCDHYDSNNADALRVNVSVNTGAGTIERNVYAFKYQEEGQPTTFYYYNYLMLVGNDGLPLLVSGTATVSGSGSSFQVPVTNGLVKFSTNGGFGAADIDINADTIQYHYENFPFNPGARGVVVNPLSPYLGLHSEKWHIGASETAQLIFTSYPAAVGGNLRIEYKRQDAGAWQSLVSGVQPQDGRYEYGWGPTGDQEQMTYQFRAVWDGGGQLLTSNPMTITRDAPTPPPPCDYSLSVSPTGTTIRQGETAQVTVTATLNSGTCDTVNLAVSDWGGATGLSAVAEPSQGTPTFSSTLTVIAAQDAGMGAFTITIMGTGPATRTTTLSIFVEHRQTYDYTISVSGLDPGVTAQVFIETAYVGLLQNAQSYQFTNLQGEHTLRVDEYTSNNSPPGTRYHAPTYSLEVSASGSHEFQYHTEYILTTNVSPQGAGTVSLQPPSQYGWYDAGSSVSVSTTPSDGSHTFEHWTLDGSNAGTVNPIQVMMGAAHNIEADFSSQQTTVKITFQANGAGTDASGTVLTIDSTPCTFSQLPVQFTWVVGSTHSISVTSPIPAGAGKQYDWRGWTNGNGLSGLAGTYATPSSDQTVTTEYMTQYQLVMSVNPTDSGTTTPTIGSSWYDTGIPVSISTTAGQGYSFSLWTGSGQGSYTGTSQTASITMNGPITETATFTQIPPPQTYDYTVTVSGLGPNIYTYIYLDGGSQQTLYNGGSYTYSGLGGAHTITVLQYTTYGAPQGTRYHATPYSVLMSSSGARTFTYHTEYQLTIQVSPLGSGSTSPESGNWHDSGAGISISASPGNGYVFQSWSGSGASSYSGSNNPASVTINEPTTETASFARSPPPSTFDYTVSINGLGPGVTTILNIDGSQTATLANMEAYTFPGLSGSHTISVNQYATAGSPAGMRYHVVTFSVSASSAGAYTFEYHAEYLLTTQINPPTYGTVQLEPSSPSGWYDAGTTVHASATSSSQNYAFDHWELDGAAAGQTQPHNVEMSLSHELVAAFTTETNVPEFPEALQILLVFLLLATTLIRKGARSRSEAVPSQECELRAEACHGDARHRAS
jgi:hypothetical protein